MSALEGIRVLDLTRLLPGPLATLVLADLGATVDKVEDAGMGDYFRMSPPIVGPMGAGFQGLNRGKRSLILDLKKPEGVEALQRLACEYDVLFEQFRPGVMDRLGLSHQSLLELNPKLIVCALTGYGQDGPLRDRAGHDLNYLARSGLLGLGGPTTGAPQIPPFQLADVSGGLWSVIAILAALQERQHTGRGKIIDIAMVDSVIPFATVQLAKLFGGEMPERGNEVLTGGSGIYGTYETKDGEAIAIGALEPKFSSKFLKGAGIDADASVVFPGPHQEAFKARVTEVFKSRTRAEWEAFADEHDCCLEPVLRPDEIKDDPHLKARGLFFEVDTPAGPVGQYRTPVTPRMAEGESPRPAPAQGEHGEAILREAGFSSDEIEALQSKGVTR